MDSIGICCFCETEVGRWERPGWVRHRTSVLGNNNNNPASVFPSAKWDEDRAPLPGCGEGPGLLWGGSCFMKDVSLHSKLTAVFPAESDESWVESRNEGGQHPSCFADGRQEPFRGSAGLNLVRRARGAKNQWVCGVWPSTHVRTFRLGGRGLGG